MQLFSNPLTTALYFVKGKKVWTQSPDGRQRPSVLSLERFRAEILLGSFEPVKQPIKEI